MAKDLRPGQSLANRFEIVSLIGRGGMANVYEARDTVLGRVVAIKVFTVDTSDDHVRLESEVRLLSGLNHPNLVTVHDARIAVDPADGPSFLVMEFVTGQTLREANAHSPLSRAAIATVAADIAEALSVVHDAGIVHRDVKPANILLESSSLSSSGIRGKLADFGIAHTIGSTRLTAVGLVVGTAGYLSPEQAEGRDVTAASDIYSLGLVLLESLKGEKEYPGGVAESVAARLARDPVIPESLDPAWSSLLTEMLARDVAARPTAAAVARRAAGIAAAAPRPDPVAPTELMPTDLMPTRMMPAEEAPTRLLPTSQGTGAGSQAATGGTTTATRVIPATSQAGGVPGVRHPVRIAVIALVILALVILAIVLAQLPVRSAAPVGHAPARSTSPSPTATPIVTPTPTPTPPAPGPPKGKGNGNGKGPGKGPGPGKHP